MPDGNPLITVGGSDLEISSDERTMAAICHAVAGLLGLALVGIIVPLIVYMAYQGRSRYVTFHALQALVFQFVGAAILWLLAPLTCFFSLSLGVPLMLFQVYYAWLAYKGSWQAYPLIEKVGR